MMTRKHLAYFACVLSIVTMGIFCTDLYGRDPSSPEPSQLRPDLISIDGLTAFGHLEKQPVEFLHDAHTKALSEKNRDCTVCHLPEKDRISLKFKRTKDTNRVEVMNIYHQECISCHGDMKKAREKTGPVECDGCHKEQKQYVSSRRPMGFDASLHFRHSEARQKKCEQCHHEYDEKEQKLFYAKGQEGTCRYCHRAETTDKVISMRLASHMACVNCHAGNLARKMESGPIDCAGCHDAEAQAKIEKVWPLPRMERKQPDVALLKTASKPAGEEEKPTRMNYVPFDHKGHETYNDTCRVCHHESLQPCNQCHTLTGTKEGKDVRLETAMHLADTERSCTGCHAGKTRDKNCAGCHALMGTKPANEDRSCLICHMTPPSGYESPLTPEAEKTMAGDMLQSRKPVTGTYPDEDIPEKVVIKHLSREYEAVEFPHRKIVRALADNIKENRLAGYFHDQEGTLCMGCHHHSPASTKPPQCASCHGKTFDRENPLKPGIIGAYHQQCMGCHREMDIAKPAGCTECHKKIESNP
ncbi:MAG: sulfate respiration complex hexadecaheme cytochrome HmcA [Thermodesulfobacteriota bacterium]